MNIEPKILYFLIFFPLILFIGIITSYEDLKASKIKNKWILAGLAYSFIVYSLFWILQWGGLLNSYLLCNFDKWCVNLLLSMVAAYLLWHFKMWGAGDAKLFICYAALIPTGQYSRVYFNYYFSSFSLLAAIFIPATVFLILKSVIYFIITFNSGNFREKILRLTKGHLGEFRLIGVSRVLLGFFFFFLLSRIIRWWIYNLFDGRILVDQSIPMLASLLMFRQLSRVFSKKIKFIIFAFAGLIVYIIFSGGYPWQRFILEIRSILGNTIFVMVLFPVFERIVDIYTERSAKKTTPFALWMFLGALITWFL